MTSDPGVPSPRTFEARWRRAVVANPAGPFLVFMDDAGEVSSWRYAEFDALVSQVADVLVGHGVGAGDSVHLALRNCPAFIATWIAVSRIGAWMVPVDPASTVRDIAQQVERVRPAVGICGATRSAVYRRGAAASVPVVVELSETADDLRDGSPLLSVGVTPSMRDPATHERLAVMFTSGTTSQPKGVVLTQGNYATVADVMSAAVELNAGDRWYVTLPLFHANAQFYCLAPAIAVGASVALTATFSASRWLNQAHELEVTHASLFAAPIRMILARRPASPPPLQLHHVWFAQSLGAKHYAEFADLVGCRPRQLYGMTETVAAVAADNRDPYGNDAVGGPLAGRRIELLDLETAAPVEDGKPGMLYVHGTRGEDLFEGYLDDPSTTSAAFDRPDEHWFRTGDLLDRVDDVLHFVGRADDVIKVSGENVSLTEVEAVLAQAPGVLEVAVVARPDPVRDQVPEAYVVVSDPARPPATSALEAFARSNLAPQARPRAWHLIDELPRTSVGKVRRFRIE